MFKNINPFTQGTSMKEKVLIYYKYVALESPKRIVRWQKQICRNLDLKGRILIGKEGINATLSGLPENVDRYILIMKDHPQFSDIDFKTSPSDVPAFPKLRVVIRDEIVTLGVNPEEITPKDGGQHLNPDEVHKLLKDKPKDLVILDTRNDYETAIGTFKDAVIPNIKNFREFPDYIDKHLDEYKDKEVLMFCTAGVRCERATAYLNQKNVAKKVYQIEGGIQRYTDKYPDGFFRGKNYVFDSRIAMKINDDILGTCALCQSPCDDYTNCLNALCNKHFICCKECFSTFNGTCGTQCAELVHNNKVQVRKPLRNYQDQSK